VYINSFMISICALIPKKVGLKRQNMAATKFQKVFLRDVEIFTDCSGHFLQDVFALSKKVSYLPGEIIREAGRANTHILVVVWGSVNIVDGKDTVLIRNDVVGIYSQIDDLGFCVYTAFAARKGAICMRISRTLLNTMLKKYPQDKMIIMRNTLKYVNRRPRAHIVAAMQMQVSNCESHFTEGSMTNLNPNKSSHRKKATHSTSLRDVFEVTGSTKAHSTVGIEMLQEGPMTNLNPNKFSNRKNKTHSKSLRNVSEVTGSTKAHSTLGIEMLQEGSLSALNLNYRKNATEDSMSKITSNGFACRQKITYTKGVPNVLGFTESMDGRSILEIQRDRQDGLTGMDVRLNAVLMAEHADSITQINSQNSKRLAQETFQRARLNSVNIDGGAPFYSNVISREISKIAIKHVMIGQTSHLKLGHNFKFWKFRCMCLSFWVMIALFVTWYSNASLIHYTET